MAMQVERVVPSPYMLHQKKPVSDVCEHGFVEYYYSKNELQTGNLEFVVEGNSEHLIDPTRIYLKLGLQLTGKATRTSGDVTTQVDISGGAKVGPINNILQSIFESVEVYVNNQATTKIDKHHAYNGYLQTLCNYGEEPLGTYFRLHGWSKDKHNNMDSIDNNDGWKERKNFFNDSTHKAEFIGKMCSPLFFQEKLLPSQTTLRVVLKKAKNEFTLMHEEGSFELKITHAVLMVQKLSVVPSLMEAYLKLLEEDHPIPYFLRTPSINYYTIESGSSQFMRDDLFLGKVPLRIVIGMVETNAYLGRKDKNPFNFQNFGLTQIVLYKDGMPYPKPPLNMDFENGDYAEAYHNFMCSLNGSYSKSVPHITMKDYKNGYTLFSFDMSPDQLGSVQPGSMLKMNSNIRLEMKFKTALTQNVTLLVYSEEDHLMEINRERRVAVDF